MKFVKDYTRNNKQLRLTKGVHVVIDQSKFPLRQAVYFDTEKMVERSLQFHVKVKHTLELQILSMIMTKQNL